ncbi:MAG: hypothetical protein HUU29_07900 [Planctomycetaceae bacterium]|nr:hypothetical protein [Planctomycetaceae bacterium]
MNKLNAEAMRSVIGGRPLWMMCRNGDQDCVDVQLGLINPKEYYGRD